MVGTLSLYEDFYGATPYYPLNTMECAGCGHEIDTDECMHANNWKDEYFCDECFENFDVEQLRDFLGVMSNFEIAEKFRKVR